LIKTHLIKCRKGKGDFVLIKIKIMSKILKKMIHFSRGRDGLQTKISIYRNQEPIAR
jgi:hypothetical protein